MVAPSRFRLLNQSIDVVDSTVWNDRSVDKLTLYNLHYFDDLNAKSADKREAWHRCMIDRWIVDNPPAIGNGWEPYPLSLRICNLVKWHLRGNTLTDMQLLSLYIQARVLNQKVEYHLQANHLLANAKALLFAGSFFSGNEPRKWRSKAIRILSQQIPEQILPDGGHFELSPMYHALILEDLLDILNLSNCYRFKLPFNSVGRAKEMLNWMCAMVHPDGCLSYFNDTTGGVAPTLKELSDYAERLAIYWDRPAFQNLTVMHESGYVRFEAEALTVIADVGEIGASYQPAHGHCDCLSFEASIGNTRVLVNTGVSTYRDCTRRQKERGTSAHNTVSVNGKEQSEMWAAFRVGRRAKPRVVRNADAIIASHDGFACVGLRHERKFELRDRALVLEDRLLDRDGNYANGVAHFHLHPEVECEVRGCVLQFAGGEIAFTKATKVSRSEYLYCVGFNETRSATLVNVEFQGYLVSELRINT